MVITGRTTDVASSFDIKWDSGQGLNNYENKRITLGTRPQNERSTNLVRIRFLDKKNNASQSTQVVCRKIVADGQPLPLKRLLKNSPAIFRNGAVVLNKKFPELVLEVKAHHFISLELLSNTRSGIVEIDVNNDPFTRDLYVANVEAKSKRYEFWVLDDENRFTVSLDLPRYPIKRYYLVKSADSSRIDIQSAAAFSADQEKKLLQDQVNDFKVIELPATSDIQKRYLSASLLWQQVVFSLLLTWLYSALYRLYRGMGGYKGLFTGRRYIFWLFLAGSVLCFSFWLLAFWPGVMSVDSLKIWRASQLPKVYLNDHPVLNVFLYSFLYHL